MSYVIGVDLGGTKIELGVLDETGRILSQQRLKTLTEEGALAVQNQILEGIKIFQQELDEPVVGIGIGVAGQIERETGLVIFAPNLRWHRFPLQENIQQALQIPVYVTNDVRAITWGEWMYGAGKGCTDLLCVFAGTGIGGGVVSGGEFLTGCTNICGEIGHITIDLNGPLCTCGKQGCWESLAGGWGIAARAREAIEADREGNASRLLLKLAGGQLNHVTAKTVVQASGEGDPLAQQLMEQVKKAFIAGCASLVNAFNPCRLILGGGVIDGMPEMVEWVDQGVRLIALQAATRSLEVVKAQLGKEVGVIGAAAAVLDLLKRK